MAVRPGPTLRRRKLVKELNAARKAARMTAAELAAAVHVKPGTMSKILSGQQGLTERNIRHIGRATSLAESKIDELARLAENLGDDGWLVEFRDDMPEWFAPYSELERDADQIWTYSSELVEGLFQTPAYAEAVIRAGFPNITEEELRRSVELRTTRQSLLDRPKPPSLRIILNEAVVRRSVGGTDVMRDQLRHLRDLMEREHVTVQILPFSTGAHPGMKTGYTLLRFPEGYDDMDCVYLENDNGGVWQEMPEHVARYSEIFEGQRELALSQEKTRDLLISLV